MQAWAQLQTENITTLFNKDTNTPYTIRPNESFEVPIKFQQKDYPVKRWLRVVGGVQMPGKFAPRGESLFREAEFLIDDNLDSVNRMHDAFALHFKGDNDSFERYAFNRITGQAFDGKAIEVEMAVKKQQLKIDKGGSFGLELHLYFKKEGRHADEVYDLPDSVIKVPVTEGTSAFYILKKQIHIPSKTVAVLVRVGGTQFSGTCWLEAPRLMQQQKQIWAATFARHENRADNYNYWVGVNLSTRSWPKWKLEYNKRTLFEGNVFDGASNVADFYVRLPNDLNGAGIFKLNLQKEAHSVAFPYEIHRLELIEESNRALEIVSVPRYVSLNDSAGILIETNKPNLEIQVSSANNALLFPVKKFKLKEPGLHVIPFIAVKAAVNISVTLQAEEIKRELQIEQVVIKKEDHVFLSSGDEVHIDKEREPYDYFFRWYIKARVGNWYHFRPSYQWSGVRITNDNTISYYLNLLKDMHVPYAWQVEGRTLASKRINASLKTLQSPLFYGKQAHENDGGYYYWQHFKYDGLFSDMAAKARPYGGIFARHRPIYTDHGIFIHYDPQGAKNMADGAKIFVDNLKYSKGESTRHTGPSTLFRYFYQAGYQWLGAEQMYGPENVILSSLRGASRAYGKKDFGSLHAVQWGSRPFTDPRHSLRFYLSLAVAYMQGSSHINTEEGLWTDEYANDRYSKAGKEHMYAQHQILDYIQTHSRSGKLVSPVAAFQGRNDAWKSFGRGSLWSQAGEKWKFNEATESFDLLKVFYPGNNINSASTDGLFTHATYGPIDILPVEAPSQVLNQYKALVFLGWNTFEESDFIRLKKFVEQGGILLLTASHINSELQPNLEARFPSEDAAIRSLLGANYRQLKERTVLQLGKGTIIYYPQSVYPINAEIKADYVKDIKDIAKKVLKVEYNKAWVVSSPHIDFTVWDDARLRTIYALNVDWKTDQDVQMATLSVSGKQFKMPVKRYTIATVKSYENMAARLHANTSDVIDIKNEGGKWIFVCQTTGGDTLDLYNGKTGEHKTKTIKGAGIHHITW